MVSPGRSLAARLTLAGTSHWPPCVSTRPRRTTLRLPRCCALTVALCVCAGGTSHAQPADQANHDEDAAAAGWTTPAEPEPTEPPATTPSEDPRAPEDPGAPGEPGATEDPRAPGEPGPPTEAPPTEAPPTEAPPTEAPPTEAPPADTSPAEGPIATGSVRPLHPHHQPIEWYDTDGQLGITVGVPFYDESIIHADMTVDIRYGRKIGWFLPYFSGGFRQARLDPVLVPDSARRKKLEAWHMTLGVRLEIPAHQRLIPFVGIAGELAHWGFEHRTTEFCDADWYPDAWRCYERYQWKAGRAAKAQVGLVYKPYPDLGLELSVEGAVVDAPEMFTRHVFFVAPAVGVIWFH